MSLTEKDMQKLEVLTSKLDSDVDLEDDDIAYCKTLRRKLRSSTTRAYGYALSGNLQNHAHVINLSTTESTGEVLVTLDLLLDADDKSDEYLIKIKRIKEELTKTANEDKAKASAIAAEQDKLNHEQALRQAELDRSQLLTNLEQLKLDNERKEQANEANRRAALHQAQLTAMQQPGVTSAGANHVLIQQSNRAELLPFDGSPCTYKQWEKLFMATVESKSYYGPEEKFLIFKRLVGEKGALLIANLEPDQQGLTTAKKRVKAYFDDPARVREAVFKRIQKLPAITRESPNIILREVTIAFEEGLKSLKDSNSGDTYINETFYRQVATKIPPNMLASYVRANPTETAESLINYVCSEAEISIKVNERRGATETTISRARVHAVNPSPSSVLHSSSYKCAICDGAHRTISCNHENSHVRKRIVQQKRLCFRCLRSNHNVATCTSNYRCQQCDGFHSKVICNASTRSYNTGNNRPPPVIQSGPSPVLRGSSQTVPKEIATGNTAGQSNARIALCTSQQDDVPPTLIHHCNLKYSDPSKLISYYKTVLVEINGQPVRVLLDGGAGRSLILEELANELKLPEYALQSLNIGGAIPGAARSDRLVTAELKSITNNYSLDTVLSVVPNMEAMALPVIPANVRDQLKKRGIDLCDTALEECPIKIILGLEYDGDVFCDQKIKVTNELTAQETVFGWTIHGVVPKDVPIWINSTLTCDDVTSPIKPATATTKLEKEFLTEFMNNKVKLCDNRYVVKLPWIHPINMGNNQRIALRRFQRLLSSLEIRDISTQYHDAMRDMISSFAELAPPRPIGPVYYLPHHPVIRLDKATTQLRIVFDGSAHEKNTNSLNDCLYKGINTWDSFSLMIKFRFGAAAVLSDIEKAFLQVQVDPMDRDALRFYWFDDDGRVAIYRFTVVPFGLSSSPFLLYAAMQKHLLTYSDQFPDVAPIIINNFYVDDLVLTFPTASDDKLLQLQTRICQLFELAGMRIRKWRSNITKVDQLWSPDANEIVKVLGHRWNVRNDTLALAIDIDSSLATNSLTKRQFASFVASVYDPMGLVSPYTVKLRLFMRKLWQEKTYWDDDIPSDDLEEAKILISDSAYINNATLPRNVISTEGESNLIIFCDASKSAVGVVAYCQSGESINILTSKAKLARDKTVPELELDAMVMAATLAQQLMSIYNFRQQTIIYSDSLLNLQRLIKHPNIQKPAIALRINKIKKMVSARYRHIVSERNIADLVSRGCDMRQLLTNNNWWHSPSLPAECKFETQINDLCTYIMAVPIIEEPNTKCDCHIFPNYGMALNIYRRIATFIINSSAKISTRYSDLHVDQLALQLLIKATQRRHFGQELEALIQSEQFDSSSVLRNYKCFIDNNSIIRLRTRLLSGVNLTEDQVCPILLPKHCHMSRLIAGNAHQRVFHGGVARTIESIRSRYYIIGMKSTVSNLVRQCLICKRLRHYQAQHDHGSVPTFRYDEGEPPFTNTGLDIFGPIKARLTTSGKRYGLIMTCATTRAVHLELIKDITAQTVFQAMRRFFARRGIPTLIYSDNGTQLTAIKKRLIHFFDQLRAANPNYEMRLKWLNLTVSSPWRGGYYERLIRDVKRALTVLTFRKPIDDMELMTIFNEIEGRMNSRPLFHHEGRIITPSHFFVGKALDRLPPIGNDIARQITRGDIFNEYIKSQRSVNAIWQSWRSQYLLQLRQFHQNLNIPESTHYASGDVVLVKSNASLDTWPLGIVERVHRSPDGVVRTVEVRTIDRRKVEVKHHSVKMLIPLECSFDQHPENENESITL